MEWLILGALAFFALIAFSPSGATKAMLAGFWLLLALSVLVAIVRSAMR